MTPPASAPVRPQGPQTERWTPQPPQRIKHRRTTGDVFKGIGAFLVLAVLLVALPLALVHYIGWPLPHSMPHSDAFRQAITPDVLLKALAVIVWLAWAQFVACVLVEFIAAARGVGMPARVPGAGPSQFLARQLIAALLMVTASAASFVPSLQHLGADATSPVAKAPPAATAGVLPSGHQPAAIAAAHPASASYLPAVRGETGLRVASDSTAPAALGGTKLYRVQPPHGRHHDSLWEIAQRHLGDGRRYREIFELNKDRVQPDGTKLTHAALIRPGWILMMPADAIGGDLVAETAPTAPSNLSPAQSGGVPQSPTTAVGPQVQTPAPSQTPSQAPTVHTPGVAAPGVVSRTTPAPLTPAPQSPVPTQTNGPLPAPSPTAPHIPPSPTAPQVTAPETLIPVTDLPRAGAPQTDTPQSTAPQSAPPQTSTSPSALTPVPSTTLPTISVTTPAAAPAETAQSETSTAQVSADEPSTDQPAADLPEITQASAVTQSADELAKLASAAAMAASNLSPVPAPGKPAPVTPAPNQPVPHQPSPQQSAQPAQLQPAPATPQLPAAATQTPGTAISLRHNDSTTTAGGAVPVRPSHRGAHSPEESQAPSTENRVLYGLAAAPLLAAGLLKALGRHRRRQLWNRVFGRRPVTASGDGAVAEESIRIGAGEIEVWFLDLALRGLSAGMAERGQSVPGAYAVRLRDEGIELLLNKPVSPDDEARRPPAPWFTATDGRSWNFPRPGIVDVDAQSAHRRFAPYPGLVTIGAHGRDQIMIDLEEARGVIGLDGPPEPRRAILTALAVELGTNSWSDRMTVTLVGFPGDLSPLAPARIRHVRSLDEILPSLETESGERAKALAAAGLDSVLDGRSRASQASSFPPHFVIVADEPHPAILARLTALATTTARVGLGFVVAGEIAGATWQLHTTPEGRITAPALGLEADAQLLPEEHYAAVLGLFKAVCDIEGADVAAAPVHHSVGYSGPLPDEQPSVYVSLLGSLEISGTGFIEPERAALLGEALVFLLHHRDGVHPRVLAAALWPRGTTADVAEATFARLATWLGEDPHGQPNLQTDPDGRLRLGPYVWSDWDMFSSLQSHALYDAGIEDQKQRDELLAGALDLVRGPFLADREPNRYGWLAYEVAEAQIPAVIADCALRLADAYVADGAAELGIEAVKAGMRGSPDDEELWRGLLRATAATQDIERLRGAIEGLYKRTWYVHGVQGLHPRTEALVNELMPEWRELFVG